jgi:hypothetical protein
MVRFLTSLTLILFFLSGTAQAKELSPLYRSARAAAMGGTSVSFVTNEDSIFLNPAGLGRVEGEYASVHYGNATMEFSQDIPALGMDGVNAAKSFGIDKMNILMGKNMYTRGQFAPSFVMPNFGIAVLTDGQGALYARNRSLPQFTLGYQNTNGLQMGIGFTIGGRKRKNRPKLYLGVGAKLMWRRGGYYDLSPLQVLELSTHRGTMLSQIVGNYSMGIGVDAGAQYVIPLTPVTQVMLGTAYTEIGDINFGDKAMPQKGSLSGGMSFQYQSKWFGWLVAYDIRDVVSEVSWRQMNHLGMEVSFPLIKLYTGINQAYITYGLSFDIWYFKVYLVSYAQELGTDIHQVPNRRYIMQFDLKFDL